MYTQASWPIMDSSLVALEVLESEYAKIENRALNDFPRLTPSSAAFSMVMNNATSVNRQ